MAEPIIPNAEEQTARMDVISECAHQIEGLSDMVLAELLRLNTCGTDGIKAAVIRIRDLTGVVFRANDEDDDDISSMRREVHGKAAEVQHG